MLQRKANPTMFFRILTLAIYTVVVVNGQGQQLSCPSDHILYAPDETCLSYHSTTKTFDNAESSCSGPHGGTLVIIKDNQKDTFVGSMMVQDTRVWHGVTDEDNDAVYTYQDGTPVSYSPWTTPPNGSYACATRYTITDIIQWVSTNCLESYGFVCQRPALSCPPGWVINIEDNVCMKTIIGKKKTFDEAREYCQFHMGDLATLVSSGRHLSLVMRNKRFRGQFWIGVHDPSESGSFVYVDGNPVAVNQPFKRRTPKNPANRDQQYCVSIKKGKWYTKKCNKRLFFICQRSI